MGWEGMEEGRGKGVGQEGAEWRGRCRRDKAEPGHGTAPSSEMLLGTLVTGRNRRETNRRLGGRQH